MFSPVAQTLPLGCLNYENRGLFADHYLRDPQRLRALEAWRKTDGLEEAWKKIRDVCLHRCIRFGPQTNEAQTEKDFIRPVLDILWGGDGYEVQAPIPHAGTPDYAFFRSPNDRREAEKRKGTQEFWRDVPVLGDAKAWETSLDRATGAGGNPSAQISNYLYRARVRWGILTNGRVWRLYESDKSRTGGVYYEVFLTEILERGNLDAFKYFYLFFRREAFLPDPKTGLSFVERVFKESTEYAIEVGEGLKIAVYDALRHLMNGFFAHAANALDRSNADYLRRVHENSLILLYRLLFILYAEDRDVLPCEIQPYGTYSLRALHAKINANLLRRPYAEQPTSLWAQVCELFHFIDEGFEEDGKVIVPAYNGGLFSPQKYPRIAHSPQPEAPQWRIGDRSLAEAIDLLAYKRKVWNKAASDAVDYATLDVQHLGSIYEGLLELQPYVAAEALVEVADNGKATFRPAAKVAEPRPLRGQRGQAPQPARLIRPGEVYLVTNRGERKATGSYYTPKYIVDYIVQNTVGPAAEEAARKVAELRADADKEIRKLERTRAEWEKSSAADAPEHIAGLNHLLEEQKRRLLEPYLALKILDPAMGSGHFLVGAADFLSLAMATDPSLLPLDEMGEEEPQAFYKRLTVERCLYGVDLNPLAVELAKLSLWLHTVSRNKALSFLDHHLRCGNSLIGARIEDDLMRSPPQFDERGRRVKTEGDLAEGMYAAPQERQLAAILELLHQISDIPTHDVETEKLKEVWYAELEKAREQFRAVANCWLAPYFGVPVTSEQYQRAVRSLRNSPQSDIPNPQSEGWFQSAQDVARQRHLFHWELEFPDVFFDKTGFKPKEQRGFDGVIGNPPYGAALSQEERQFLTDAYRSAAGYKNSALHFIDLAHLAAAERGHCGLIVPKSLTFSEGWRLGRDLLLPRLRLLADVSKAFEDVLLEQVVTVFSKAPQPSLSYLTASARDGLFSAATEVPREFCRILDILMAGIDQQSLNILPKLISGQAFLGQITETFRGLPLQKSLKSHGTYAIFRGDHICRFHLLDSTEFISASDLEGYQEKVKKLRQPKLVSQNIVAHVTQPFDHIIIMSALDTGNHLNLDTVNNTVCNHADYDIRFLLSLMNAKFDSWYAYLFVYNKAIRTMHFDETYVGKLPIPRITFATEKPVREKLLKKGKRLYEGARKETASQSSYVEFQNSALGRFVGERLTAGQSDVVHDLLAYLAEQMIEMNKEKQTEAKGFLAWLERHIGARVDDLGGRTKLRAYYELDLESLLDILRRNSGKMGKQVTRAVEEDVEREFQKSMHKLRPLLGKIAATDRLIDLIVYRLYDLNEDEVAIIEGAAPSESGKP